jgi:hypothetical protein
MYLASTLRTPIIACAPTAFAYPGYHVSVQLTGPSLWSVKNRSWFVRLNLFLRCFEEQVTDFAHSCTVKPRYKKYLI